MRLLAIILVVVFAVAGIIFGALNADMVSYDLAFASIALPKGAALIAALLLGWIVGGALVWLFSAAPARRRLARQQRGGTTRSGDTLADEPDEMRGAAAS
ncbi:MAG TPA: DUF1049 domain-containing protein [Rhodanobacteraceae bacterium]|nr:DUF1049 domain-containing protein [Rhodanobacteraceae bacterium]